VFGDDDDPFLDHHLLIIFENKLSYLNMRPRAAKRTRSGRRTASHCSQSDLNIRSSADRRPRRKLICSKKRQGSQESFDELTTIIRTSIQCSVTPFWRTLERSPVTQPRIPASTARTDACTGLYMHMPVLCVCLLLQELLQSCARGGRRIVEDMCYEIRRAEACVD